MHLNGYIKTSKPKDIPRVDHFYEFMLPLQPNGSFDKHYIAVVHTSHKLTYGLSRCLLLRKCKSVRPYILVPEELIEDLLKIAGDFDWLGIIAYKGDMVRVIKEVKRGKNS